jgi:glycosyltransferase involved in cell wall biosynthesis
MVNKKHILFIVENNTIPFDARVWNEAKAAKESGYDVSIICPKDKKTPLKYELIDGISVYRHYTPFEAKNKFSFLIEYGNAILWEFLLSLWIFIKKPFSILHSANPPDHIFLIALFYKLFGVKFVFDHHDICPENYIAKFGRKDIFYRLLLLMEKLSIKAADIVISTNESYKKIAVNRSQKCDKDVIVVRNGPDLSKFIPTPVNSALKDGFDYLVSYVGIIGNQEGIDNLLKAVEYIVYQKNIHNIKFIIIGTGTDWENMVQLSKELKLENYVQFTGYIKFRKLCEILSTSDICVNPEFKNEFTNRSTMIKVMEYMVFGKPMVVFETTEGKVTAGDSAIYVKDNNINDFANSVVDLLNNPNKRKKMGEIGKKRIVNNLQWDLQKLNLIKAYQLAEGNCE